MTRTFRVPITLAEQTLEYTRCLDKALAKFSPPIQPSYVDQLLAEQTLEYVRCLDKALAKFSPPTQPSYIDQLLAATNSSVKPTDNLNSAITAILAKG